MPIEPASEKRSVIDILDRVLDKGIVIDAWVRVSLVGIDLLTAEARIVVASISTYLEYSEALARIGLAPGAPAIMPRSTVPPDRPAEPLPARPRTTVHRPRSVGTARRAA